MIAIKLLPILQVIIILCSPTYSYATVYGTKRYGRLQRSNPTWTSTTTNNRPYQQQQQQMLRTQRYPMNYYDMYPYTPDDYYYPREAVSYPIYYPRTSKYEVYQAVWPYYYDRPYMRTGGYGYYGYDDSDSGMDEDAMHDVEREQREEAQPIGQEMYYENDSNNNDVNAAFLQNLIMSQMYKDSMDKSDGGDYGKLDEYPKHMMKQDYYNDDEDVMELKQLAKPKEISPEERLHWFQKGGNKNNARNNRYYADDDYTDEMKRSFGEKSISAFSDRKATARPSTTVAPKRDTRGQKEEVLFRPATPVKHPFTSPILNKKDRQRTPSVYDTIKHMLDMEKSLENVDDVVKPAMRKRIVASEDSLTQQLSVLKKQILIDKSSIIY